MLKLIVSIAIVLLSFLSKNVAAQTIKMTVAQAGVELTLGPVCTS
jgi:hypothetical protein